MANMTKSLYNIRFLDELGEQKTIIHDIHPLAKLITTIVYLIVVVSYDKYEISGLIPLILFPLTIIILADIPAKPLFKRLLIVLPFVIGIGIFNPILDHKTVQLIGNITISSGWLSFISIIFKCVLTVIGALLLICTTGMNNIALSLRILKVPKLFVMQLLLTYRYISVLIEEFIRTTRAYSLRSPSQKGIKFKDWGSVTGQLLMRTIDRAQRIYTSMCCRGFQGEYHQGNTTKMQSKDYIYTVCWILFFILVRYFNIPKLIGFIMTGVI